MPWERAAADQPRAAHRPRARLGRGRRPSRRPGARTSSSRPACSSRRTGSRELVQPVLPDGARGAGAAAAPRVRARQARRPRPAVRHRARRVRGRARTAPSSATTCWPPAGPRYEHRLRYQTFDVTDLARRGAERDRRPARRRLVPRLRRLRRQARRSTATGSAPSCSWRSSTPTARRTTVVSDGSWRSTLGPVTRAGIYSGETDDLRQRAARLVVGRLRRRRLDAGRVRLARRRDAGRTDRPAGAPHGGAAGAGDH